MNTDDIKQFKIQLAAVAEIYDKPFSERAAKLFYSMLEPYDITDVKRAFQAHVRSSQFPPKPADIVKLIEGDGASRSMTAWRKLVDAIKSVGPHRSVCFDDPLINAAVATMGGWPAVCEWTDNDLPFRGNEFRKFYEGNMFRNVQHEGRLVGIADAYNKLDGKGQGETVLIGDQSSAAMVLASGVASTRPQIGRVDTGKLLASLPGSESREEKPNGSDDGEEGSGVLSGNGA